MSASDRTAGSGRRLLLQDLLDRIADRLPPERAEMVGEFARAYMRRTSGDVFASVAAEELFGQVIGAFDLADARGAEPIAVRAFNPTLAGDGYTSVGTVVETNTEDSPFLVDSVVEELQARGLTVRVVLHPVIGTERDAGGRIVRVLQAREAEVHESVMHFEVDRHLGREEFSDLEAGVRRVLRDVRLAVGDFAALKKQIGHMIETARQGGFRYAEDEVSDTVQFLEWLREGNFVLLGYREYELVDVPEGKALRTAPESGLGILRDPSGSTYIQPVPLASIEPRLRGRIEGGDLLMVSRTNRSSTVHRRVKMNYVGVKRVEADGSIAGELRLLGLFTSKAYMQPASQIPLLRRKLARILASEDLLEGSHDYKTTVAIFESFPKDELFAASTEELRESVMGLLELQEQEKVRLFWRRDLHDRSVSLVVALPRDRFNAPLRQRLQALFMTRLNGSSIDYHLSLGETDPALIHFVVHVAAGEVPEVSYRDLEQEVVALTRTWDDRLRERLVALHAEERGGALAERWSGRLPDYYKSSTDVYLALLDIEQFERLEAGEPFAVGLQNERGQRETLTRVGLYKTGGKVQLSDFMPILEALGLVVVEEVPTRLSGPAGGAYLHDFGVLGPDGKMLDLAGSSERIAECIAAVWRREAESDSLNRLVVSAGLDWRQVAILRAYRKYRQRVSAGLTEEYQNDAFAANPHIAAKLVRLFELRFDPARARDQAAEQELTAEILADLDAVASLDQDRILRGYLGLVEATVRTNAFRLAPSRVAGDSSPEKVGRSERRPYLSFKIRSAAVPDMPKPFPLYEIFVYSPEMEGIHLRGGKVARGGIRWSDRMEDYRTEILGLMKAQITKNAVIVPTGSKGGFVLKRAPAEPDALRAEVERQYVTLIRGLLDVTDNLVEGTISHPPGVRVLDEEDPYLVVAADKGTATFSDTANAVAEEYGFWLLDAFASGGSAGYDHRKLAITARGAWESVKRHFRELGTDVTNEPIRVVGIGDMSGDVFGNGMLLSSGLRLVAAFDHRHVFIDPDPDPAAGFAERRRLFELPGSSWDDYERGTISAGGGVWPRSAKSIPLSPEARAALGVEAESLPPNEVIRAILRAPVDLLWNGGIGTYVKASDETNAEVGDRMNDATRVDARELRAKVAGEGGNLGFTQRARVEFARAGGRINTDFIDNSGGVDCSDHEVNLKILLNLAVQRGDLTRKQRDRLLAEVAGDVTAHVLYDNYLQVQILSQAEARSAGRIEAYEDLMQALEAEGILEREIERLPETDELVERRRAGAGMERPELSVLLAYAKRSLKNALLASNLPDDPYLEADLRRYFPGKVVERFAHLLGEHPLRRELVATILANDIVNSEGITFVSRTVGETGSEAADVVRAYRIARDVTDAVARWDSIEVLDGKIDPIVQNELLTGVDSLVGRISRWYLQSAPGADLDETIAAGRAGFAELSEAISTLGSSAWRALREEVARRLVGEGVPEELARRHAFQPELVHAPDVVTVAQLAGRPVVDVARAFIALGEHLHIDWLEARLDGLPAASRWQRWALDAIEDDLMLVRRELAQEVIDSADGRGIDDAVVAFLAARPAAQERLGRFMGRLTLDGVDDLAALTVAVRQIRGLLG